MDSDSFGYILSIGDKNHLTSYSLTYLNSSDESFQLSFNLDGVKNLLKIPLEESSLGNKKWIKISLKFNPLSKKIILTVDDKIYSTKRYEFETNITPNLFFGKHGSIIDVPLPKVPTYIDLTFMKVKGIPFMMAMEKDMAPYNTQIG